MMRRRGFLAAGSAGLLAACAGRFPSDAQIEADYPPVGAFTASQGLRVHYWQAGNGPDVVLIHGASGNLRDWTYRIAPRLAQRYRVTAFDRPGFGYTDRPAERGYDTAVQARVLAGAAQALGLDRPVLVGHSWGAAVALAWAVERRAQVRGVCSVSGAVLPYDSGAPSFLQWTGIDVLIAGAYGAYLRATADDDRIEQFVERIFRPQEPPPGYAEHVGGPLTLRAASLEANAEDLRTLSASLRRQSTGYETLPMPIEALSGTADRVVSPERHAIPLVGRVPNGRLTLLDGVGHMAHHAAPAELDAAIDRLVTA